MSVLACLDDFLARILAVTVIDDLAAVLDEVTHLLGFQHYALVEHIDLGAQPGAIRLHSYPDRWAARFDADQLGAVDPVHRASRLSNIGFAWADLPRLIDLSAQDRRVLASAAEYGIDTGFTVPANVPGEICGSCSFAGDGRVMSPGARPLAELAGVFAFEAARRLWHGAAPARIPGPRLTDRERDCVIWVGRNKSDWETAQILGISRETVVRHVKNARRRYSVDKRTALIVLALFDGTISFRDLLAR